VLAHFIRSYKILQSLLLQVYLRSVSHSCNPLSVVCDPSRSQPHPYSNKMDSCYIEQSTQDLHQSRSRSNSHLSTTTSQFQDLSIKATAPSTQEEGTSLSTKGPTSSSPFLNPDPLPSSSNFISAPQPQQLVPFPDFSHSDLDTNWSSLGASEDQPAPTPLLRLDSVPTLPSSDTSHQRSISRSNSFPVNMSAVGVQQYDSQYDAGVQPSYTWPRKSTKPSITLRY